MKRDASPAIVSPDDGLPRGLLLSVGCNRYDTADALQAAEADAEGIYAALTSGPAALYDPAVSVLLRSPTRAEIDASLRLILERHKGVGTFTVYFAGHGAIADGSLYLCPSDTSIDALSVTSINVSQVLRVMSELRPGHAYLIIDACFSGGVALDLNSVLRADILDRSPGFGLSILASAHKLKGADETSEGGLFTTELLKALTGEYAISAEAILGLGDIVRKLEMSPELKAQQPNFWDLNLSGADSFCRNPLLKPATSTSTAFGTLRYQHPILSEELARHLWQNYLDAPRIDVATLPELFRRVIDEQSRMPVAIEATSSAIADSFADALEAHEDTFAPALARVAMVRALMPHHCRPEARRALSVQLGFVRAAASDALAELESHLQVEQYYLLGDGGLADLYYLPLRLSKLLGWIGFLMHSSGLAGTDPAESLVGLRQLTQDLLKRYGNSVVAVGDDQASGLLLFLSQCKAFGWVEEAEEVLGRLYLDFNAGFGRVLVNSPTSTEIIDYLLQKDDLPFETDAAFLQNPCELFSVILLGAAMFDLDEAIDTSLIELDHTSFSFYIPKSYGDFWQPTMEGGRTLVFQLGHGLKPGYGIWNVQDMHRTWCQDIVSLVNAARSHCDDMELLAAALVSLVVPDRIAWFAVPSMAARVAIPRPLT